MKKRNECYNNHTPFLFLQETAIPFELLMNSQVSFCKKKKLDAKRDTSRANKQKTESPDKDARQSNDARKRQKVDDANIPGKNARDDEGRPDKDNENQAGQPGPVDEQKEKENACDKSTATGMFSYTSTVHG